LRTKHKHHLKSIGKTFSQTAASKQRPKQDTRQIRKEAKSNPSALEREVATEKHQMRSERRVCLMLGSSRLPRGRRRKNSFEESSQSTGRKDECQVRLIGREYDYCMGTKIGMLRGYVFQGQLKR